ncbi:S8 family serine peptidase, partial [Actinoplanes sp. NPDC051633]|uniref:S8 family peptidase n=1 Tax=Actinoplanes sp. NPDC051633 TaxID=3155670 RepID=UPI003434153C
MLSLVAASALIAPAPAIAAAAPAQPAPAAPRTVTLISGDHILVSADGRFASRVPGTGRDGVALITERAGGRLRIIPADAVPLLNADRLDQRLFDVTGLLAAGYDDSRADLPLIVTFDGSPSVGELIPGAAASALAAVDGWGVRVTRAQAAALWPRLTSGSARYRKIWLDGIARPATDVSVPLVGAPAAWAAGLTGGGVKVGVLDTGLDADHPDLAGAIAETADFTGRGDGGVDVAGHGTAVASVLAGSGAASGGRYRGMAPDVRLYGAKVCAAATRCQESAILEGMRWAVQDKGVKVVNLSAGERDDPGTDLLEEAVDRLTAEFGALFVVAAGNGGEVRSPASAPSALAVGATTEDDEIANFSPAARGDKPDLLAPGVDITAARSGDSRLDGRAYTNLSGTSLSAPHVAGAAALLAEQHPEWTAAQLKAALVRAATPLDGGRAARLDVAKAVESPLPEVEQFEPEQSEAEQPATFRVSATYIDRSGILAADVYGRAYGDDGVYDLSAPLPAGTYTLDAKVFEPDGS